MMPPSRPPWYVEEPVLDRNFHDFFISHVAEDQSEVVRLKQELESIALEDGARFRCFLDVEDWPTGVPGSEAIRDVLLRSRHVILWITPRYLGAGSRGWVWYELAYAELIQNSIKFRNIGKRYYPYILPIFHDINVADLERTPLLDFWGFALERAKGPPDIPGLAAKLAERRRELF